MDRDWRDSGSWLNEDDSMYNDEPLCQIHH